MKKIIFACIFLLPLAGSGQVYFTALNFPTIGTIVSKRTCDTTGVSLPVPGHAQNFNYGTIPVTTTSVSYFFSPDSLWCHGFFPTSTIASVVGAADWYYKQETDTLRFLGNCLSDSSMASTYNAYYFKTAIESFTHMNYAQVYHDSAYFQYGTGEYRDQATTFEVIADGSLTVPTATYPTVFVLRKEVFVREHGTHIEKEHYLYYYFYDSLSPQPVFEISLFSLFGDPLGFKKVKFSDITNGISETSEKPSILVYPNPFTEEFFVNTSSGAKIDVYNLLFEKIPVVVSPSGNAQRIAFQNQPAGVYFARIQVNNQTYLYKLVKH